MKFIFLMFTHNYYKRGNNHDFIVFYYNQYICYSKIFIYFLINKFLFNYIFIFCYITLIIPIIFWFEL